MLTVIKKSKEVPFDGARIYQEIACLDADLATFDTDTLANGSKAYIMDASNNPYYYDQENDAWYDSTGTVKS